MIEECVRILQENKIPHYIQTKKGKGTWKTKYEILISGFNRVSNALPVLMPYIRIKRTQAEMLSKLCGIRLVNPRNPYTEKEHQIVTEIRRHNKGGDL